MRILEIKNNILYDEGKDKVICPIQSIESAIFCDVRCAWFNKKKDKTCDAINIYCKEYFIGILKE